ENFLQVNCTKFPEATSGDDLYSGTRRNVVLVAGQRGSSGAEGSEQNLVFVERGWLQDDSHAVGQFPLGDADGFLRSGFDNRARRRKSLKQLGIADGIDVGFQFFGDRKSTS